MDFLGTSRKIPGWYIKIDSGCFHPLQFESLIRSTVRSLPYGPFKTSPKYDEPGIMTRIQVGRPRRRGLIPGSNNQIVVQTDPASCPVSTVGSFAGE
jgi:hypothetical protein